MELDDMKNLWQQYDKKLQENKMLNESIIRNIIKDRSKSSLGKMSTMEYLTAMVYALLLLVYTAEAQNTGATVWIRACYFFTLAFSIAGLIFTVYKIKLLSKFDFGAQAITDAVQKLEQLRLLIVKERLISILLSPLLLITFYAVINFWVYNADMFQHFSIYAPRIAVSIILLIIASIALYRKVYFDNIYRIRENLNEIRDLKTSL